MTTEAETLEHQHLERLPFDLKEHLIGFMDSPRTLLSMALASKEWAAMIIPDHLNYRKLGIRLTCFDLWKHLALRTDLCRNIHTLRLAANKDLMTDNFFPNQCSHQTDSYEPTEETVLNMTQALSNLQSLRTFIWIGADGPMEPIFHAVVKCSNLSEVWISRTFSLAQHDFTPKTSFYQLKNLTKLALSGSFWPMLNNEFRDVVISMLNNSENLQELTISYNPASPMFTSAKLSQLVKLHLLPDPSAPGGLTTPSTDNMIIDFLILHPKLEELRWYPSDLSLQLPGNLLPSLKRLHSSHRIATTLLRDPSLMHERKMEAITQISLGENTMNLLRSIDGSRLQKLDLWRYTDLELKSVAELFPALRSLSLPNFGASPSLNDSIDCLASFPALEELHASVLWFIIRDVTGGRMQIVKNWLSRRRCFVLITFHDENAVWEGRVVRTENEVTFVERPSQQEWVY